MAEQYDIAIVGAGPGGYVAAIRASQLGLKAVVIEKDKPGGVCLNIGCIPSKTLIHQAELYESLPELEELGIQFDISSFDYAKAQQKSRKAADTLSKGVQFLLKKNNITLISGTGVITSPGKISVESEGKKQEIQAKNIIIATGSRPRNIPGFEFDGKTILSSDDILMMRKLPESMIILGAGAIGSEFAYILSSFGVKVTVVEMLDQILPTEEKETAAVVAASFKKKKVIMHTGTRAVEYKKTARGITLTIEKNGNKEEVSAEKMLVVVGRVPNTENIGLESVGIKPEKGFIPVKDYYQTRIQGIYAIGDVVASPMLAHVASKEGEIVVEHLAGHTVQAKIDPAVIPGAVYTNPGVASFGFREQQLKDKGKKYKSYVFPYRGAGKSVAINKTEGLVKILCDTETGEILGGHVAGEQATELIHEILLGKSAELLPEDLATMIHAHPTLSEAVMEAMRGIEDWAIHV